MKRLGIALVLLGCSGSPAVEPAATPLVETASAKELPPRPALIDLGAQVWISEPTGSTPPVIALVQVQPSTDSGASLLVVELFAPKRQATVCNPDSSCPACNLSMPVIPPHLDCTLNPDSSKYEVRRAVTVSMVGDTMTLVVEGETGLQAPTPSQFVLTRANPLDLAFTTPKERAIAGSPTPGLARFVRDLSRYVADEGVDPLTLPQPLAAHIAEDAAQTNLGAVRIPNAREELLRSVVADKLLRWRDKHPPR